MSDDPITSGRKPDGRFAPGNKHSRGRPKGSRHKLSESFIHELCLDFEEHGRSTIETVRETKPDIYLRVVASILPKDLKIETNALEDLSTEELDAMILALRDQLSEAVDEDLGDQPAPDGEPVH